MMNDSWCPLPFAGVALRSYGAVAPCCKFIGRGDENHFYDLPISDALRSDLFLSLQAQFNQGQRPDGCKKCWLAEDQGLQSYRQMMIQRLEWPSDADLRQRPRLVHIDVALGNLCNSACIGCDTQASHKWLAESQELALISGNPFERFIVPAQSHQLNIRDQDLTDLRSVVFIQSEAMLQPGLQPLLEDLRQRRLLEQVEILISTNATYWPKQELLDLLEKTRRLEVQISIDAVGPANEFLRYPARWPEVAAQVDRWCAWAATRPQVKLIARMTLSALNVLEEPRLRTWLAERMKTKLTYGAVHNPWFLSPMSLPETFKRELLSRDLAPRVRASLSQPADWHPLYQRTSESTRLELMARFVRSLETSRGLRFADAAPELAECIFRVIPPMAIAEMSG